MKTQKKLAMSVGGAVLAACLTLGGIAAANAAESVNASPHAAAVKAAATVKTAAGPVATAQPATAAATAPVPALPDHPYNWDEFIKTLSPAQQRALLGQQQALLTKYQAVGGAGSDGAVEKFAYNVNALKKALGE